jgi:hypothetical protein
MSYGAKWLSNPQQGPVDASPLGPGGSVASMPVCRPARWWIKVFVPLHILAITLYAIPEAPPDMMQGKVKPVGSDWILFLNSKYGRPFPLVQAYTFGTGFWQYWDMFSPDPVWFDQYCTATIIYKSGKIRDYQYPRMYPLSIPQKFLQERYRKFYERAHDFYGNIPNPRGYVAQRFAQRIALINDPNPNDQPTEVKLYMHQWNVPAPGQPLKLDYGKTLYFDYVVDQDLLAKDKAGGS